MAIYIKCICPSCQNGIEFDDSEVGTQIKCPHCENEIILNGDITPLPELRNKNRLIPISLISTFVILLIVACGFSLFLNPPSWQKTRTIQSGTFLVSVGRFYMAPDFIPTGFGDGVNPTAENLHILICISNESDSQKFEFRTWRGVSTLTDSGGNSYFTVNFPFNPNYLIDNQTIYPHQTVRDILVFEKPVLNCNWYHLSLNGNILGGNDLRFEIPPAIYEGAF